MIVIDSMRGSMLNPEFAPNISRYAETEAIRFNNHFSGGNSSRMGMFSLLYSLPPAYWAGFTSLQRSTALLDEMQARDFQLGLYSSGTIYRPVGLDRTAFANVPNLRIMTEPRSDPHWKRDIKAMEEYFQWLDAIEPGRPFFWIPVFRGDCGRQSAAGLSGPL